MCARFPPYILPSLLLGGRGRGREGATHLLLRIPTPLSSSVSTQGEGEGLREGGKKGRHTETEKLLCELSKRKIYDWLAKYSFGK